MCIRDRSFTCLNFKSMKAKRMIKKFVAIVVLILVATLSVAGCTSSNNSPSPSAQATSSALSTSVTGNASTSRQGVDISVSYVGSPESIGPLNATPSDGYKWFVYNEPLVAVARRCVERPNAFRRPDVTHGDIDPLT